MRWSLHWEALGKAGTRRYGVLPAHAFQLLAFEARSASYRAMRYLGKATTVLTLSLVPITPATAQTASIEVENRSGAPLTYRAASGYQGSLPRPLPLEIGARAIGLGEIRAGFPATQGGGFRYGNGREECDFGLLRMRDGFTGPWGFPQTRARAIGNGLSCRAQVIDFSSGGDFTIRFTVE